jgi:hypothetical protein
VGIQVQILSCADMLWDVPPKRLMTPQARAYAASRTWLRVPDLPHNFAGDPSNAERLLDQIEVGINWVFERAVRAYGPLVRSPHITLRSPGPADGGAATANQRYIHINPHWIADRSFEDLHQIIPRYDGYLHASALERLVLNGIEEAHHCVLAQLNPGLRGSLPLDLPLPVYLAQELEFRALDYKRSFARQTGMRPALIRELDVLYGMAKAVRKQLVQQASLLQPELC